MELREIIYAQARRLKKLSDKREENGIIFHASEAGDCKRRIMLRHLNKEPTSDALSPDKEAELEMLFADGRLHQAAVTGYLHQAPNIYVTNIEDDRQLIINDENIVIISGHPDGLVHFIKKKVKDILEVKGLNHFSCQKLKNGDVDSLKEVYSTAIPQARMYSKMYDTNGARIIVKNKNTSALYEFYLERNKEAEDRIIQKFCLIASAILEERDSDISCDYMKGDPKCKFCPYPTECGYGKD